MTRGEMETDVSDDRDSIHTIYTLDLGLLITTSDQAREQGRLGGSSEGAGDSTEGAGGILTAHSRRMPVTPPSNRGGNTKEPEFVVSLLELNSSLSLLPVLLPLCSFVHFSALLG